MPRLFTAFCGVRIETRVPNSSRVQPPPDKRRRLARNVSREAADADDEGPDEDDVPAVPLRKVRRTAPAVPGGCTRSGTSLGSSFHDDLHGDEDIFDEDGAFGGELVARAAARRNDGRSTSRAKVAEERERKARMAQCVRVPALRGSPTKLRVNGHHNHNPRILSPLSTNAPFHPDGFATADPSSSSSTATNRNPSGRSRLKGVTIPSARMVKASCGRRAATTNSASAPKALTPKKTGTQGIRKGLRGAFDQAIVKDVEDRGIKRKRNNLVEPAAAPEFVESGAETEAVGSEMEACETDDAVEGEEAREEEEASVAEMSLDDLSGTSEEEDDDIVSTAGGEGDDDARFYLFKASRAQLKRLRRDRLVELAKLLLDGGDEGLERAVEAATKDALISRLIDARRPSSATSSRSSRPSTRSQLSSPRSVTTDRGPSSSALSDVCASSTSEDSDSAENSSRSRIKSAQRLAQGSGGQPIVRTRRPTKPSGGANGSCVLPRATAGSQSPEAARDARGRSRSLPQLSDLTLGSDGSLASMAPGTRSASRRRPGAKAAQPSVPNGPVAPAIRKTRSNAALFGDGYETTDPVRIVERVEEDQEGEGEEANSKVAGEPTPRARKTRRSRNQQRAAAKRKVAFSSQDDHTVDEGEEKAEDEESDVEMGEAGGPTPIAKRTRHASVRSGQALNNLSKSRRQGSRRAAVAARAAITASASEDDDDEDDEEADLPVLWRQKGTRGKRERKMLQLSEDEGVEDGDGDDEDDEVEVVEVRSEQRSARKLRNGKVVRVSKGGTERGDFVEQEDEQGDGSGEEVENEEVETSVEMEDLEQEAGEEEEESADDEEHDHGDAIDLQTATSKGLLRLRRDSLVKLCEERELQTDGTKKDLVQSLLQWRETNAEDDDGDTTLAPDECNDDDDIDGSGSSASTAHGMPTAPLRAAKAVQRRPSSGATTPILLQSGHQVRSCTQTPGSKASSSAENDVGELDLESLNLQDREIAPEALKKLERIGSGGFKDVYRGVYKKMPVAIADFRGHLTEMDLKELRILRDLRHENIVRFIGVSVPEDTRTVPVMIVTEICTNGDLFDYIREVPAPEFGKILRIMRDIARGLDYLHTRAPSIIHRDLKSSNVLITARGVAKLNDFGLARIKNSTKSMMKSLVGTVNWQAPELWVPHPRYNEKVDVYSAGMVYWEALQWHQAVKRYPFEGSNEHAIYHDVGQRQLRPSTAGMRRQWGDEILDLIERLWAQNPCDRPKMSVVLSELDGLIAKTKAKPKSK